MAFGKKNKVKIDPFSYNIGLLGEAGIGKTTIIKEMCEKHLGEDGYLFVECGKEDGADAIEDINYINCPEYSAEYDEYNNSVGFSELIEDIIENKTTEYPNLRVVVIDTYDQLREIVIPEIVRLHNKENPEKRVKSIKAAFGGFMAGEDMVDDMILDALWSLKTVGVHFICIGHLKQREITDAISGESYMQVTTDMSMRSFNKLKNKLHFLGVATINREIIKEKKNANSKDTKNVVVGETRQITFRDNNYSIDAKSRFASISNQINFDADILYQTLCDAIELESKKSGRSLEDVKAEQERAEAVRMQEIAEAEEKNKAKKELDVVITKINDYLKENKADMSKIKPILTKCKEYGIKTPSEITSLEDAKAILKLIM